MLPIARFNCSSADVNLTQFENTGERKSATIIAVARLLCRVQWKHRRHQLVRRHLVWCGCTSRLFCDHFGKPTNYRTNICLNQAYAQPSHYMLRRRRSCDASKAGGCLDRQDKNSRSRALICQLTPGFAPGKRVVTFDRYSLRKFSPRAFVPAACTKRLPLMLLREAFQSQTAPH